MTWPIHEKIQRLLKDRKLKKKDLAAHLGIAPQTMTDICKGRSAVTLNHLRGLVSYFRIRADYWIDDDRETPGAFDMLGVVSEEDLRNFENLGVLDAQAWDETMHKVRSFLERHRGLWEDENGPFSRDEAAILSLHERMQPASDTLIPRPPATRITSLDATPSGTPGERETEPA